MLQEMIFAGFGGQGVLSMGTLLAYAAMKEGKDVSWMPSYGPEMRGGTANCIVNISDQPISSPIVSAYDVAVVFNQPSLKKFEQKVKKGGILIWESTTIKEPPSRKDIRIYPIPAIEKASQDLKNVKVMNMLMLGVLLKINAIVKKESVLQALKDTLPERHHHLIPLNKEAIDLGMSLAD
ncbi:MAG: 2-oxoacid:acceptor oxidoreductase family protein [Candidatus Aminicenantes bacterium]|nr:MAG: 2-oxoacid:acceptor oxidoreductase family protein [Candidatus Aminicenantes bacterium]